MTQVLGLAGAGNSKKHQETIADLLYAFMTASKKFKKYNKIKSLPEIGLDVKIPDIVVYKFARDFYTPLAIFEICNSNRLIDDIKKCKVLIENNETIEEAFIIDISGIEINFNKLYRLKTDKISTVKKSSKFDVLNIELSNLLYIQLSFSKAFK